MVTSRMRVQALAALAALLVGPWAMGCSQILDGEQTADDLRCGPEFGCPAGQECNAEGRCVPVGDADSDSDSDADTDADSDSDTDTDSDTDIESDAEAEHEHDADLAEHNETEEPLHCEAGQCAIEGRCVQTGEANTANPCEVCDPDRDGTDWSANPLDIECRAAKNDCDVAEKCDGISRACPDDLFQPDSSECEDGDDCTVGDACQSGVCIPGSLRDSDGDGHADQICGGDDCNDDDDEIHAGLIEDFRSPLLCEDGKDNDCDDLVDSEEPYCPPLNGTCLTEHWCWSNPSPQGASLRGIWGSSSDDVWFVGAGVILHWNGAELIGEQVQAELNRVWGAAPDDLWAVGKRGVILHNTGAAWEVEFTGFDLGDTELHGVWGLSAEDVWVVGENGTILHRSGETWIDESTGEGELLRDVGGVPGQEAWAVGDEVLLRWDGDSLVWRDNMPADVCSGLHTLKLYDVEATGESHALAVGTCSGGIGFSSAMLLEFDEHVQEWKVARESASCTQEILHNSYLAISSISTNEYRILTECDANESVLNIKKVVPILHHWRNDELAIEKAAEMPGDAVSLWATPDNSFWLTGLYGSIEYYDRTTWKSLIAPSEPSNENSADIISSGIDTAWCTASSEHLLRWDGHSWNGEQTPIFGSTYTLNLHGIWGTASDETYLAGTGCPRLACMTNELEALLLRRSTSGFRVTADHSHFQHLWTADASNTWAVGKRGAIYNWNGAIWHQHDADTFENLNHAWGSDDDHVWAVGAEGTILFWDGNEWTPQDSGVVSNLTAVWGTDELHVWAADSSGGIIHFDGDTWQQQRQADGGYIRELWGLDENRVFAVGANGLILRWKGFPDNAWVPQNSNTDKGLGSIFGLDEDHVWVTGANGVILRHTPGSDDWTVETSNTNESLRSLHGVVEDVGGNPKYTVLAVGYGGTIRQWTEAEWIDPAVDAGFTAHLQDVWVADRERAYVVGYNGFSAYLKDGTWQALPTGTSAALYQITGTDRDHVLAAGGDRTLLRWLGDQWSLQNSTPHQQYNAIWGADADHIWAVGQNGAILASNGHTWLPQPSPSAEHLNAVWGRNTEDVYIVGDAGTLLHLDAGTWVAEDNPDPQLRKLRGVWGNDTTAWAVGDDELILTKTDDQSWALRDDVFVGGLNLTDICGVDSTKLWVSAAAPDDGSGAIYHWNGLFWDRELFLLDGLAPKSLWCSASGDRVFAAGNRMSIFERRE